MARRSPLLTRSAPHIWKGQDAPVPAGLMHTPVYLGADLGGTNLRIGLRLAGAAELLDLETVPASREWEARDLVALLTKVWERAAARHEEGDTQPGGVGFGLTGDIDCEAGTCHSMKRF